MAIKVGSARIDENGKASGGSAGDQTGNEVSTQTMYTHSKGWYIIRPKSVSYANKIAKAMKAACDNNNIGYDQSNRLGIIKYGTATTTKTECDCSSLVRQCVIEATGKDPGNFTTANEATKLDATGLFEDKIAYVSQSKTPVYNGDILVTKTQGHTVVVVSGNARSSSSSSSSSTTAEDSTSTVTASKKASKKDESLAGTYVTTAKLNIRDGAGTGNKVLVTIPKGTSVKNYGYYSPSGAVKWLYVQFTYNKVTYTGFASKTYLKKS